MAREPKKAEPRLCLSFFLLHSKLLIELINSTLCGSSLLVSGVERMALGTDFHVNLRLGRTGYKGVPAVAGYRCLIIAWMNSFSHNSLFLHDFQPCAFVYPQADSLVCISEKCLYSTSLLVASFLRRNVRNASEKGLALVH